MEGKIVVNRDKVLTQDIPEPEFEGYTLDEIRHQRALIAVKKEFAKAKLMGEVEMLKDRNPFAEDGKMKAVARLGSVPMKIMKGLNYTDYVVLGLSILGSARKVFSFFRKKKN